jgi:hypothetical protein
MLTHKVRRTSLLVAVAFTLAPAAWAQHVILNAPGLMDKKAPAAPPPVRPQPTVWPRLDSGAVLCRSEYDLDRHAENMVARAGGGNTVSTDCRIIPQPIGIQILSRQGPGRTQVKLSAPDNSVGWTDAWLPDKAPVAR